MASGSNQVNQNAVPRKPRILLAATGSVMALRFGQLCHAFSGWADVQAILTKTAAKLINPLSLPLGLNVYSDGHESARWTRVANPVLRIEMYNWADALVIAPLSANTLAKIAGGRMVDNLLTTIARGWNQDSKPFFTVPCIFSSVWSHPLIESHLRDLGEPEAYRPLQKWLPNSYVLDSITPEDISADMKRYLEVQLAQTGSYKKIEMPRSRL